MASSAGGNKNVTCMDVSVSLGLYISERNSGPFKDAFITFSESPKLQILRGSLSDRYKQLNSADWGYSTNLEKVFDLILNQAIQNSVPESEMPTKILILSDMEFNKATESIRGGENTWNPTAQEMIEEKFRASGYNMPSVVYWNIQSRGDNIPVSFDKSGTALISGFSPSILKSVVKGEITSPSEIMDETILSNRYSLIHA
jgi:hypothetical protein